MQNCTFLFTLCMTSLMSTNTLYNPFLINGMLSISSLNELFLVKISKVTVRETHEKIKFCLCGVLGIQPIFTFLYNKFSQSFMNKLARKWVASNSTSVMNSVLLENIWRKSDGYIFWSEFPGLSSCLNGHTFWKTWNILNFSFSTQNFLGSNFGKLFFYFCIFKNYLYVNFLPGMFLCWSKALITLYLLFHREPIIQGHSQK